MASGTERQAAVLGSPITHSLSPVLHTAAYEALGLSRWSYGRFEVDEDGLEQFLDTCDASWAGLSLTMPLKQRIFTFVDHVDPLADVVGAINTVLFSGPGGSIRTGVNTDVHGLVAAIRESSGTGELSGDGEAVVIGGGATAASALAALGELGYTRSTVAVRNQARAAGVQAAANRMGVDVQIVTLDRVPALVGAADVVISTVPSGASKAVATSLSAVAVRGVLLDVVYDPRPTALMQVWRVNGGLACGGERMLLHQAAEQVRLMTGQPAPIQAMDDALTAAL